MKKYLIFSQITLVDVACSRCIQKVYDFISKPLLEPICL